MCEQRGVEAGAVMGDRTGGEALTTIKRITRHTQVNIGLNML